MFKTLQFLKFLLTSTNQHGVHSPFVYNYVTKCLYSRPDHPFSKSVNVLLKSIAYFDTKLIALPENLETQKIVAAQFPHVRNTERFPKIIFLNASEDEKIDAILSEETAIINESLILIDAIHNNKVNIEVWNKVKLHQKVRVTVDMFYCGVVFFRKEQAKEHFKIRI